MHCSQCGEHLSDQSKFCASCGAGVTSSVSASPDNDAVQKFLANLVDGEIAPHVTAFDRLDQNKLDGARKSYLQSLDDNESVLVLFDDTVFGSSKKGFAITDRHFVSRVDAFWGGGVRDFQIPLTEIQSFRIEKGKLATFNVFINDEKVGNISMINGADLARTNMLLSLVISSPQEFRNVSLFPSGSPSDPVAAAPASTASPNATNASNDSNWLSQLGGLAALIAVGYFVVGSFSGFSATSGASQIIKESLKSPSSFSEIDSRVLWEGTNEDGKDSKIVRVEYEAQNGFGQ